MDTLGYMLWFLGMALLVNLVTYGGVTLTYFLDKRRVDPPRPVVHPASSTTSAARLSASGDQNQAA